MISYIKLKNFKSFPEIALDLRERKGAPKKLAFIYGENGAGKSNLMKSIQFLEQSFMTMNNQFSRAKLDISSFDRIDDEDIRKKIISSLLKERFFTLEDLLPQYWMIGNEEPMEVEIGFYFHGKEGRYTLRCSRAAVLEETLHFVLEKRSGIYFSLTQAEVKLSPSIFPDEKYRQELLESVEKFWGKHTFLSILFGEVQAKNFSYMTQRVSDSLLSVMQVLRTISVLCKNADGERAMVAVPLRVLQHLDKGVIRQRDDSELLVAEKLLNEFFTQLYSDIKKAQYHFYKVEVGYRYELYFDKLIGGVLRSVPVSMESSGTKKLLDIFPLLFTCSNDTAVFVDEVDSGIHDLLMKDVVDTLKGALGDTENGQFIATTHNTLLLDSLEPENVYILRTDAEGNKEISCVSDYAFRTQKNHSIRHRYLEGIYQGIPETGYVDLKALVDETMHEVRVSHGEADNAEA